MKKLILFLIFSSITYFDIRYVIEGTVPKPYLYTRIDTSFICFNYLDFFYRKNSNINSINNINITTQNLFNSESKLFSLNNLEVYKNYNTKFFLIPFFTKEIIVKSSLVINNNLIETEQFYKPYLEFGIRPFWAFIPVFEYAKPIVIFKIGENQ